LEGKYGMKKIKHGKIAAIGMVLLLGMVFTACDDVANSGTAPVILSIFTSTSEYNCLHEVKTTTFTVGQDVWIGIVVTDPDKDVVSVTFTFGKVGTKSTTLSFSASAMVDETVVYAAPGGHWESGDQGTWEVVTYVRDRAGNRSNPMQHSVTVK
jgi:hypothetical protein